MTHTKQSPEYPGRFTHRGARVIRELRGNDPFPICPYHNWRYDITGNLKGVSMEKGTRGKGGYGENFDKACHGLQRLHVDLHAGVLFATFCEDTPPLREYLGEAIWDRITMMCTFQYNAYLLLRREFTAGGSANIPDGLFSAAVL